MQLGARIKKKGYNINIVQVFYNMHIGEQESEKRKTKRKQVSVSYSLKLCNKRNISHAKRLRLYKDETKPYSDSKVYFICFEPPWKKENRTFMQILCQLSLSGTLLCLQVNCSSKTILSLCSQNKSSELWTPRRKQNRARCV